MVVFNCIFFFEVNNQWNLVMSVIRALFFIKVLLLLFFFVCFRFSYPRMNTALNIIYFLKIVSFSHYNANTTSKMRTDNDFIAIPLQSVSMKNPCVFCVSKTMRKPLWFQQIKSILVQIQRFSTSTKKKEKETWPQIRLTDSVDSRLCTLTLSLDPLRKSHLNIKNPINTHVGHVSR